MPNKKRVVGVGRIVLDHVVVVPTYPECDTKCLVSEHWQQVGGPVPVALSTASHYGIATVFLGTWGQDSAGRHITAELTRRGIDISGCQRHGTTGFAQIWTEQGSGKRTVAAYPGGEVPADELGRFDAPIAACQIAHLDGSSATVAGYVARRMREQGGLVVLDAGSRKNGMAELIPLVDVLVASDMFCRSWFGRTDIELSDLLSLGCAAVIRTRGVEGATYSDGQTKLHQSAVKVLPVDTNGAGDIFCGGFLRGLAEGWEVGRSLLFANRIAGHSCAHHGNETLPES